MEQNFSNVYNNIAPNYFSDAQFCESAYIAGILHELSVIMQEKFEEMDFVIYSQNIQQKHPLYPFGKSGRKEVVLYISDESSSVPHSLMDAQPFAVFKNYLLKEQDYQNLFPMPLGYVHTTALLPVKLIEQRPISVFFSGALHYNRQTLYRNFIGLNKVPNKVWTRLYKWLQNWLPHSFDSHYANAHICFNKGGFRSGLSPERYAQLLHDAKIAICPKGINSAESFRHFEAMRAGCIIVSEPLPEVYFYKDSPIIVLENWNKLDEVITDLLSDPKRLQALQNATLAWWEKVCSEKAVARYIAEQLMALSSQKIESRVPSK